MKTSILDLTIEQFLKDRMGENITFTTLDGIKEGTYDFSFNSFDTGFIEWVKISCHTYLEMLGYQVTEVIKKQQGSTAFHFIADSRIEYEVGRPEYDIEINTEVKCIQQNSGGYMMIIEDDI